MTRTIALALAATLAGSTAFAAAHEMNTDGLIRAEQLTDSDLYTTNTEMDDTSWDSMDLTTIGSDWNDIGDVDDVVMNADNEVVGIIAEVGGFLDIGDKDVMIPIEQIKFSMQDDGSYIIVTRQTEEQLEQLNELDGTLADD